MRITEKLDLINKLTKALYEKYDDIDIECFFNHYEVKIEWDCCGNNREDCSVNAKATLQSLSDTMLINISNELQVGIEHIIVEPPKNWENNDNIKAFISHLAINSKYATKLRNALKKYNIDSFVAHEDIRPSEEWQKEIIKALNTMDFFISLHTEGFAESVWCQQEIGYAVAKGVKIIPIKFDGKEDPSGFIAKFQALIKPYDTLAPELAKEIVYLLKTDERTKKIFEEKNNINIELSEDEIPF